MLDQQYFNFFAEVKDLTIRRKLILVIVKQTEDTESS